MRPAPQATRNARLGVTRDVRPALENGRARLVPLRAVARQTLSWLAEKVDS